ncbi:hypothetical protein JCM3774_006219 [Rhodotorula dairenensis]
MRLDTSVTVTPVSSPELSPYEKAMPYSLKRTGRAPSAELLLPGLLSPIASKTPRRTTRWSRAAALVAAVCTVAFVAQTPVREQVAGKVVGVFTPATCEERGMLSPPLDPSEDAHRLVVRVHSQSSRNPEEEDAVVPENRLQPVPLHPDLSSRIAGMFSVKPPTVVVPDSAADACVPSNPLRIDLKPRSVVRAKQPELFFALCTPPDRAYTYSSVWTHYMLASETRSGESNATAPGCLVTDAQGTGNTAGMARANDEFRRQGLGCVMRDTSRVNQRYEMRVLGLLREAWIESQLRTRHEGAPEVEWFVFGDDDTWWSDPAMLREFVSQHDHRQDHIFGTFSETVGNYQVFGRIAFGGGGIIISRSLLEKMQPRVDECAEKFQHVTGGDGMISECAAMVRGVPLSEAIEETRSLRQMDIRGDATGYLTDGTAPFLSLHHWTSWLELIPGVPGLDAIKLLTAAANAVGGPNLLRRWVFDNGAVTWSVGYAITVHRKALSADDLSRIEWTWNDHEPRKPSRRGLVEGIEKHTYYISEVRELSPGVHLFRHVNTHPSTRNGISEIDVIWDARTASASSFSMPSWPTTWIPGGRKEAAGSKRRRQNPDVDRVAEAATLPEDPPRKHARFFGGY